LVLASASKAFGVPLFASPPHFVADDEVRQIIFFLNEPTQGALAVRAADDVIDVIVPESRVDATVQGARFQDADAKVRGLVMTSGEHGATTIRIETEGATGDVSARSADDPPRLIVRLVSPEDRRAARRVAQAAVPRARPTAQPRAKKVMPTEAPAAAATVASTMRPTIVPTPTSHATGTPLPTATDAPQPEAVSGGVRIGAALAGVDRPAAEVHAAVAPVPDDDDALPCAWRRWFGVPFCAPYPGMTAYGVDAETAALAIALATPGVEAPESVPGAGPALDYLRADTAYVSGARMGRMLGAIQAYRRVLRRHPEFVDAPRARLNIALAYRAMGFEGELRAAAATAAGSPTGALLRALAGDLALESGALERARQDYAAVATQGDLGACLGARGALAISLERTVDGALATSVSELERQCPRALFNDPETRLLRARVRLAAGDIEGARALLIGLEDRVPARSRARVIATRGAVAESAGDRAAARAAYEGLAAGDYGARAAQSASARLAVLDAADGDIEGGLRRLKALDASSSEDARRTLVVRALAEVDGPGAAGRMIAVVHEAGLAASGLPLAEQIRLAGAYRRLGLHARATEVLEDARRHAGSAVPESWWIESTQLAHARGGWSAALTIADRWVAAEPRSGQAMAARARALAGIGSVQAAGEALAQAATKLDPSEVRDLRFDVGGLARAHDPKSAQRFLEEAAASDVDPALSPSRAAELLWELGDVAEANGDEATARVAFARLMRGYAAEPAASLAAYRHGRLAAPLDSAAAYDDAVETGDGLERRAAEAAREFEAVVATLAPKEAP